MMTPTNQQQNLDVRYRTMLTLWFALFMSIVIYFAVSLFLAPQISNPSEIPPTMLFTIVLSSLGTLLVLLSFMVKRKILQRSVDRQEVALVQQALIIACVMCEVSALLGLVMRFVYNSNEYYLLFLIAAIGIALHFPRRDQLLAATYKTSLDRAAS